MLSLEGFDDIASIEHGYSHLDFGSSSSLLLPMRFESNRVGARAALIQLVITWATCFRSGRLVTHAQTSRDADTEVLSLCLEEIGLVALLTASDVALRTGDSIRRSALSTAETQYRERGLSPTPRGTRISFLVADHLGVDPTSFYQQILLTKSPPSRKEFFAREIGKRMTTSIDRAHAKTLKDEHWSKFLEIIYELFANAEEWGSYDLDRVLLSPAVRGIIVEAYSQRTHGPLLD